MYYIKLFLYNIMKIYTILSVLFYVEHCAGYSVREMYSISDEHQNYWHK